MKKLLFGLAIIMSCYAASAQSLTVNNNVWGDVYIRVYTAGPGNCTPLFSEYVDIMIPANTVGVFVDLSDPANWNMGMIPTAFDLVYADVSRDLSCPGTMPVGTFSGPCSYGSAYFDQVTVGNSGSCSYSPQDCVEISLVSGTCGGFTAGDVVGVIYSVSGTAVTIDVKP